jgi:catechol 2,3-dioxygenase-like lactoylglutathione lyase family enzyme
MAVTSLQVVSVPVTDQDRARDFYAGVLGFTVEMDTGFAGGAMRWVALRPPGGGTAITLVTWFESMPAGSLTGSVLGCDDLEQTLAELSGRGLEFAEEDIQEAPWGR